MMTFSICTQWHDELLHYWPEGC